MVFPSSGYRVRKDPYLTPWGGEGGLASSFPGLPWGVSIPFIFFHDSLQWAEPLWYTPHVELNR